MLTSGKNGQPVTKVAEKAAWEETQAHPAPPSLPAPLPWDPLCPTSLQASENYTGVKTWTHNQHSPQRPGAGLQLASLQLTERSQQTTGTQAGGLPACQVLDPTSVSLARSPRKHLSRVSSPGCRLEPPPASRPRFYCLGTAQEQVF